MKRLLYILLILLLMLLAGGCTNLEERAAIPSKGSPSAQSSKMPASETSGAAESVSPSQPLESATIQPSEQPSTDSQSPSAKNQEELKSEMNKLDNTLDELKNLFDDVDFDGMDEF